MLHCLSANDYGQPERSRKFHSPLHPDIMDLDKKLTTKDNQWLLKVSYCGTFQPSGMGAALIRMVIWDQYPPTTPSLSESVSAVLLSVIDFFVQKYLVQYQLLQRSRPTNKRNREQKYITKKQALSTKMELFQILCIHFDHKCGTELVSSNTLWITKPISL